MDKQTMIPVHSRILLSNEKNGMIDTSTTWMSLKGVMLSEKKSNLKMLNTILFPFIQYPQNMKNRSVVARVRFGIGYNYEWVA